MPAVPHDIVLSPAELEGLTGFRQQKKIAAWLTEHGWIFEQPGGRGSYPAVDRSYYLARMSGQSAERKRSRLRLDRM